MEKPEALGAAGGLRGESPGGSTKGVPGEVRVEAGPGLSPGVGLFHGSESPMHPGGIAIRSPGSDQTSRGKVTLGSEPSQHLGEVAGRSLGSGTCPGGLNPLCPAPSVTQAPSPGSRGLEMNSSECDPRSGSTCLHLHNHEDRPRSILKKTSSISMPKPSVEKKKSQHWDEGNILATYHPAGKDYGFMKVDEPSTPYRRFQDSYEDLLAGSSNKVTPEEIAERFAKMDKTLQYGDNRSSGSSDNFSKTYSSDFDKRRRAHYDEGKFLKAQKKLPVDDDEESNGAGGSGSSGSPDSSTYRSQSPRVWAPITLQQGIDLQRKEYYCKGIYLRSCSRPELQEDTEDEQDNSTTLSSQDSGSPVVSGWCQWLVTKELSWQSPGTSERECTSKRPPQSHTEHKNEPGQR
ncbi:uncharacterized protein LOC102482099 isoform X2 [Tupaia chinensis]|uniref:uncharacterized protein LOC102482099 isoform X2 n=1 Tax=Tupaia chinensis TaxID=246437 RepID=UPI0003C8F908|nr:uncharacterized protein LOC102482099 isoform X2 [Tupaia chinensis]